MPPEMYITPRLFCGTDNLVALQTTRKGGVSPEPFGTLNLGRNTADLPENVQENTERLCRSAGLSSDRLAASDQVHGTAICHVRQPGVRNGFDALVTAERDVFLCVFTADCFPVLLFDPQNRAVAAIHAGWKGTAGNIVPKTIAAMTERFGTAPRELIAWIGTGISQAEYEVSEEVAERFPSAHCRAVGEHGQKVLLDLAAANAAQLIGAGVPGKQIERSPFCSSRDSGLFYSYRRDAGKTGRMATIIGLTSQTTRRR